MSMSKLASVHDINSDFTSWKRGDFIVDNNTNDSPRLYFWDGRSIIPPYTLKDDGICIPPDFTVNEFSDVRYHESIRGYGIKNFKYVIWVKIKPENISKTLTITLDIKTIITTIIVIPRVSLKGGHTTFLTSPITSSAQDNIFLLNCR